MIGCEKSDQENWRAPQNELVNTSPPHGLVFRALFNPTTLTLLSAMKRAKADADEVEPRRSTRVRAKKNVSAEGDAPAPSSMKTQKPRAKVWSILCIVLFHLWGCCFCQTKKNCCSQESSCLQFFSWQRTSSPLYGTFCGNSSLCLRSAPTKLTDEEVS